MNLEKQNLKLQNKIALKKNIKRHIPVYIIMSVSIIWYIIFRYFAIWTGQIAFKDFIHEFFDRLWER